MGRPRKYESDAARQAAFASRWGKMSVAIDPETVATIKRIAEQGDCSISEVVNQLCKFALLNFAWTSSAGVTFPFKRLPKQNPE
jgi:hypothetical protein